MSIIVTHEYFFFFIFAIMKYGYVGFHMMLYYVIYPKKCKMMPHDAIQCHTMFDNEEFVFLTPYCTIMYYAYQLDTVQHYYI